MHEKINPRLLIPNYVHCEVECFVLKENFVPCCLKNGIIDVKDLE